ncbi:cholinesterase-like, partial [Dendronephthya gigantea]|uniref:cholinesterase-like n=1 Tax=Dendronephthya gigantea TaxID=151771 RepID=UPI00106CCBDC
MNAKSKMHGIALAQVIVVVLLECVAAVEDESVVVEILAGKVGGKIEETRLDGLYVQKFLNIYYAEAPVGKLRFVKPQPKKPWNGLLEKPEDKPISCPQGVKVPYIMSEDCLVLNVWTPHPRPKSATVMIYVHGGGYTRGTSGSFHGHSFVAAAGGDVILVTINYRLFDLGFLVTRDESVRGNFALFDQRLAFKWVHENIERFGGDPDKVTIFGESAGAGSTSSHFFSEDSWPYFQRSILQSGSITFPMGVVDMNYAKNMSEEFLGQVGCKNDEKVLECLQNLSTEEIMEHYRTTEYSMTKDFMLPVLDGDFFKKLPAKMLEEGQHKHVDLMIGVCEHEAFLWHFSNLQNNQTTEFYINYFKQNLQFELKDFSGDVHKKALELYEPKCYPNYVEALRPTIDFQTDKYWSCETTKLAKTWSDQSIGKNVYVFRFSYAPPLDILVYYPQGTFGFAAHASDLMGTFGMPINHRLFPEEDRVMSSRMVTYWTNFAKNG